MKLTRQGGFQITTLRTNQALVDASGTIVKTSDGRILRPDVQVIDNEGKVHIIEVSVSSSPQHERTKRVEYIHMLGPAFGSYTLERP